jgi:hypothetical protein
MGWFLRKSIRMGPVRVNLSKRGIGTSVGVKGLRVGTGPRGPYVAGGRGGVYFRQQLGSSKKRTTSASSVQMQPVDAVASTAGLSSPFLQEQENVAMQQQDPPYQPHQYSGIVLAALTGTYVLAWLLIFADASFYNTASSDTTSSSPGISGSIGITLFFILLIAVLVIDWRGFTTLNGWIRWRRLSGGKRFWLVCAYIVLFEFMQPIYLVLVIKDYRKAKAREPLERQMRTAHLESELGLLPETEGVCRHCGKPLQVGAQFCAYCRTPVVERPRICPVCATTALPDARWCPNCGAPLPTQTPG